MELIELMQRLMVEAVFRIDGMAEFEEAVVDDKRMAGIDMLWVMLVEFSMV